MLVSITISYLAALSPLVLSQPVELMSFTQEQEAQGETGRGYTEAELDAVGRAVRDALVSQHGESDNQNWQRMVGGIVDQLRDAVRDNQLNLSYTIIDDPSINAAAAPGG